MISTAHVDTFARDNLPPREQWPELIFDLPELRRVPMQNAAVELLDRAVERGTDLTLRRSDLPEPEEGAYYVFQLVGLAVHEEGGRELGRVVDVEPGVANDALALEDGTLLPLVDECVLAVDLDAGRVVVASGFADAG